MKLVRGVEPDFMSGFLVRSSVQYRARPILKHPKSSNDLTVLGIDH